MPLIANQTIASGFGTFPKGSEIPDDLPPATRDAWLEAGIIGEPIDEPADQAPIETATAAPAERAVGRRLRRTGHPSGKKS